MKHAATTVPSIPTVLPPSLGPSIPHVTAVPPGRPAGRDKGTGEGGQQAAIEMLPDAVKRWQGRTRTSIPWLPAHRERGKTLGFSPSPPPGVYHGAERHKSTWLCKANWPVLKHKAQDRPLACLAVTVTRLCLAACVMFIRRQSKKLEWIN